MELGFVSLIRAGFGAWPFGRSQAAVRFFTAARAIRPQSIRARKFLVSALTFQGDLEEAIAECRDVIRLKPDDADSHLFLASALALLGDWPAAIAESREAVRLQPEDRMYHFFLGMALLTTQGKPREAAPEFAAAIWPKAGIVPARKDSPAPEGRPRPGQRP
jgi:tetratricopeptide (TPR) repeat protein